jgi:hypothetical protein
VVWTDLMVLVGDTARVWWRLLPQISTIYLLGWLGSELSLRLAVIAGDLSPWLALALFTFNFVCVLGAAVVILSQVGRELGIRELIPADEADVDDRETSMTRLLTITLLPFLGMYAAFGQVRKAANRLFLGQTVRYGILSDLPTITGVLNQLATEHVYRLLAIVVGIYVLRRLISWVHERSGWRGLGFVVVLIESFFLLMVILGGIKVIERFMLWLTDRAFVQWLVAMRNELARFLAVFRVDLPQLIVTVGHFLETQVWPVLWDVLTQPILWLAVAALIYGSRVLTLAELWRKGQPYASRVPGASVFARFNEKRALRRLVAHARLGAPPKGIRLAATQVKEAFFGDIDDKYLPTFHSLRLVLRAGVAFLGSYVLLYTVIAVAHNSWRGLVQTVIGGHPGTFWVRWEPVLDLLYDGPFEPLRLCLLAVAFRRCLEVFRQRSQPHLFYPPPPDEVPRTPAAKATPAQVET